MAEPTLGSTILTPALLKFYREFPKFLIHVEMNNCDDPSALLENNRADLVLAEKPLTDVDLAFISLLAEG